MTGFISLRLLTLTSMPLATSASAAAACILMGVATATAAKVLDGANATHMGTNGVGYKYVRNTDLHSEALSSNNNNGMPKERSK